MGPPKKILRTGTNPPNGRTTAEGEPGGRVVDPSFDENGAFRWVHKEVWDMAAPAGWNHPSDRSVDGACMGAPGEDIILVPDGGVLGRRRSPNGRNWRGELAETADGEMGEMRKKIGPGGGDGFFAGGGGGYLGRYLENIGRGYF